MGKGYVFLSNSTKPTNEEQMSRNPIKLTNVSKPCLEVALNMGYDVFFGVNRFNPEDLYCELPIKLYDSHTYRNIFSFKDNKIAYKNLMHILKNNDIDVIHCNTPVGGLIGRLCGKKRHTRKIIYTAHGFHFYKGNSKIKNFIFKTAEKIMAKWTDAIITMNKEDYENAKKFKLRKNGHVYFVHGVGIDLSKFSTIVYDDSLREMLGFKNDDILLISAGDLVPRKNYSVAIKAVAKLNNNKVHYLICGIGPEKDHLIQLAKNLNVEKQIHFLGYRNDILKLMKISNIFIFTTLQEGLPRSLMEAMASGLPCVVSKIRGNVDLIENGVNGFLCNPNNPIEFSNAISILIENHQLMLQMKEENLNSIKNFSVEIVKKEIENIYKEVLSN